MNVQKAKPKGRTQNEQPGNKLNATSQTKNKRRPQKIIIRIIIMDDGSNRTTAAAVLKRLICKS
jgi:hypothetical protein